MLCESYKQALTDAAAAHEAPSHELAAHLNTCAACRSFFAEEQRLFGAIQAGVASQANSEVPSLFLQRARARLANDIPARPFFSHWAMFATVSLASIAVVFVVLREHHNKPGNRELIAHHESNISSSSAANMPSSPAQIAAANRAHSPESQARGGAPSHSVQTLLATSRQTPAAAFEVLVPPEEREGLARYIATQKRIELPAEVIVADASSAPLPAQIAPLEIADLEMKPLPDLGGDVPDSRQK